MADRKVTREQAFRKDLRKMRKARNGKASLLEREIRKSSATDREKADMLHTLSKLSMFSADERDWLVQLMSRKRSYDNWIDYPTDGSS